MATPNLPGLIIGSKMKKNPCDTFLFKTFWETNYNSTEEIAFYVDKAMVEQTFMELAWVNVILKHCGYEETQEVVELAKEKLKKLNALAWVEKVERNFLDLHAPDNLCRIIVTFIDKKYQEYNTNYVDFGEKNSTIEAYETYVTKMYSHKGLDYSDNPNDMIEELIEHARTSSERAQLQNHVGSENLENQKSDILKPKKKALKL